MPTMVKKPTSTKPAKTAGTAGKLPDVETRPILYPDVTVNGVPVPTDKMRLSTTLCKKLLGYETEEEYKKRCEQATDVHERAKGQAGYGDNYHFFDGAGLKVRCWNSQDNRPFDDATADRYAQDALNRQWAGPEAFPGETVNGETVIIGRTGKVLGGNHRMVGCVRAAERWQANPKAYPEWKEEPFIETLVVFGVSENPIIVRTLDNVRPRTLADTVYTSDVFRRRADGTLISQGQRKELSRMLDAAIDYLWRRTGAGGDNEPGHKYQTHSASFDFLDRHERLKAFVKHLFECNADRRITLLQLSAGQCAAACYLMAAGASDVDEYLKDRAEGRLDFSLQDKAEEFFDALADGGDRSFKVLREALGSLKSIDEGLGGRVSEKMAVLAAGWHRFRQDEEIREEDVTLSYGKDANDNPVLLDPPDFGGIDGGHDPVAPERTTPKQAEAAKKKEAKAKTDKAIKATKKGQGGSALEALTELKKDHPGKVLLFRDDAGDYNCYGEDAMAVATDQGTEPRKGPGGVELYHLPAAYYETVVRQMTAGGAKLAVVRYTDGTAEVVDVQPRKGPSKAPPAAPAPAAQANGQGSEQPNGKATKPAAKPKLAPKKNGKAPLKGGIG